MNGRCRNILAGVAICAVAGAGCGSTSVVRYRPDRTVVRSIPAEVAREALRDLLERAFIVPITRPAASKPELARKYELRQVEVAEDSFAFVYKHLTEDLAVRHRFERMGPSVYRVVDFEQNGVRYQVRLFDGASTRSSDGETVYFVGETGPEDAEKLVDCLLSLKAGLEPASPPGPAR